MPSVVINTGSFKPSSQTFISYRRDPENIPVLRTSSEPYACYQLFLELIVHFISLFIALHIQHSYCMRVQ